MSSKLVRIIAIYLDAVHWVWPQRDKMELWVTETVRPSCGCTALIGR